MTMSEDGEVSDGSPESAASKLMDDPCEMCHSQKSKYSCPGCHTRTCSLPCVQLHKTRFRCDGVARRTKMVTLEQFDALTLLNDYRFLEEAKRVAAKTKGKLKVAHSERRDFKKIRTLVSECKNRRIRLEMSPWGMRKSTTNTSAYNHVAETIFWTIEWIFVDADNYALQIDKNLESVKLDTLLRQFIKARPGCEMLIPNFNDDIRFAKYHLPPGFDSVHWSCYLRCERNGWTKDTRYYKLDPRMTLCENLAGKVIIEYPTIYVACLRTPDAEDSRFPLLMEKTLQSLLQKRMWERTPVSRSVDEKFRFMDMIEMPTPLPKRDDRGALKGSAPEISTNGNSGSQSRRGNKIPNATDQSTSGTSASLMNESASNNAAAPMRPLRRLLRVPPQRFQGSGSQPGADRKKHHWNPFAAKRAGKRKAVEDLAVALSAEKEDEEAKKAAPPSPVKPVQPHYPDVYVEEKKEKSNNGLKNDYFSLLGFHYASSGEDDSDLEEGEIK